MIKNEAGQFSVAILADFNEKQIRESSERYREIRNCSFFDSFPDKQLSLIAKQAVIKKFAFGACLTTERTPETSFFVILSGTATAYANETNIGIIQRGECIGEGLLLGGKHLTSALVVANGEVVAWEITKRVVDSLSDEVKIYLDKALLQALFKKLQRSRILNEILHKQKIAATWRQA